MTDNGREYCGSDRHPYELYWQLNDIAHRTTRVRRPQTNGFVERFNRTVLDEFFRLAFGTKFYETVEELQADLDQWLVYNNTERPHHGYRNMGKRPIDTVEQYLKTRDVLSMTPDTPSPATHEDTGSRPESDASARVLQLAAAASVLLTT